MHWHRLQSGSRGKSRCRRTVRFDHSAAVGVEPMLVRATLACMPYKLAFMTLGILRAPVGHEQVQGFVDRAPSVYQSADASDGFHARSIREMGTWLHSWGAVKLPACYPQPTSSERIA